MTLVTNGSNTCCIHPFEGYKIIESIHASLQQTKNNNHKGIFIKVKKKGYEAEARILDLEKKLAYLKHSLESYKRKLSDLKVFKVEYGIYHDVLSSFMKADTAEDLYNGMKEVLCQALHARYFGVFLIEHQFDQFIYRFGKGYKPGLMSRIPRIGSLMGEVLFSKEIMWIQDIQSRSDYIPLNQEPPERNVLIIPIFINGDEFGVLRFANIDPMFFEERGDQILKKIIPLFCANLERIQQEQKNRQALVGLKAAFTIARQLESNLEEKDIIKNVFTQVPEVFDCKGCVIAVRIDDVFKPLMTWPEGFYLGGNNHSHAIYIRNLIEAFPKGNALIKDLQRDKRWSWPLMDVGSLCMVGLNRQKRLKGVIIAVSKRSEEYSAYQQSLLGLIAAQMSITLERAAYFKKQEELASHDGLTGLLNHRIFQDSLRLEMERAKRYKRALSLVIFDIDHFKKFNDTHGHLVGDEVLRMVSATTKRIMRVSDMAFRYGGEEFCVLLPETEPEKAAIFAERLRKEVQNNRTVRNLAVTVSLGITGYNKGDTAQEFIDRADSALYTSKKSGRNRTTGT